MSTLPRYRRKIFIGDVHGCYDELMHLLSKLEYESQYDQLYFVGDLVVKGPKSNQVIDFVRTHKNCFCVLGNHDYYLLRAAQHIGHYPPASNGKDELPCTVMDEAHPPSTLARHMQVAATISLPNIEYLRSLPFYQYADDANNILVVHAGIVPNAHIALTEQTRAHLMTIRNAYICDNEMVGTNQNGIGNAKPWISYYGGHFGHIFFGHDAVKSLQIGKYATGLDTGCCYGDRLTAAVVKCDEEWRLFEDYQKQEQQYKCVCREHKKQFD